jgi:quercetin dioxygenase-like cupin family protein
MPSTHHNPQIHALASPAAVLAAPDTDLLRSLVGRIRRFMVEQLDSRHVIVAIAFAVALVHVAIGETSGVIALVPHEMHWSPQGGFAMPGMEQANLVGDPKKPGPYTLRLKFPAGYRLAPHTHPDAREVTILSGTFYTGYGERWDNASLKELPAGSFYTEPANLAHFIEVREPVLIQVSGVGPSTRKFLETAATPDSPGSP